jgi:hypothetical protein
MIREPTDDELAEVFAWHHNDRVPLSEIGRRIGARYPEVRRILTGELLAERTKALRETWPPYEWRARHSTGLSDAQMERLFHLYHEDELPADKVGKLVGRSRQAVEAIIHGHSCADQTAELRRDYGTRARSRGRVAAR